MRAEIEALWQRHNRGARLAEHELSLLAADTAYRGRLADVERLIDGRDEDELLMSGDQDQVDRIVDAAEARWVKALSQYETGCRAESAKAWKIWDTARFLGVDDAAHIEVLARALNHAVTRGWCDGDDPREGVPCEGDEARDVARVHARRLFLDLRGRAVGLQRGPDDEALDVAGRAMSRVPSAWRQALSLYGDIGDVIESITQGGAR